MPKPITEAEIESIIDNFEVELSEYEIIDIEKYQGWSSKHLYLIVSSKGDFVLKAKSQDQISGYDNEVKVCSALLKNGILTRTPILSKNNNIFYETLGYYWCLMSFIPGAPSHVEEYDDKTVKSLAEHINEYVSASITKVELQNLDIKFIPEENDLFILDKIMREAAYLESLDVLKVARVSEIYKCLKDGYKTSIGKVKVRSINHNDINARNILIDHKSKKVIALIDWDHVRYGNPLKDISDAAAIFYDNLSFNKAEKYRKTLYKSFTYPWFQDIQQTDIEYAFLFYFTISKWRAAAFYLSLLKEYDNKYGERDRFIWEMKQAFSSWTSLITSSFK